MSEELISKGYVKRKGGIKLGKYDFFDTNRTNLNSFSKYGFIPKLDYGSYFKREPDGLLVDLTNKKHQQVIVVIEYKKSEEFRTKNQQKDAREQCNDLCQILNAFVGVISDGQTTHWINPKQHDDINKYSDRTTGKIRSYSIISNEDKKPLTENFVLQTESQIDESKFEEETKNTFYYLDRILASINEKNSQLKTNEDVDPSRLAESVWQDIYINTAKSPVKCLYNVVELFIFKFLSDLNILQHPYNFDYVLNLAIENNGEIALSYYAKNVRPVIKDDLFKPSKEDKTTIINGTIFVDENEQPVKPQASLFKQSLIKYSKFGSLRNIQKDFKTKLFEKFLKQSSDKNKLGQFFTPRKVVTSVINMTDYDDFKDGMRICDPFCGVGGFIAEFLQKPSVRKRFFPDNTGHINPKISFMGFDKGLDTDDERTIILAKANMLIYLSDILEKYPKSTEEFSNLLNSTFTLIKDNIGTLGRIYENENDKFDIIITNPPYITAGSTSIKKNLDESGLMEHYTANGKGVDGLALEWMIRNLKRGGKAYIVLSNSLLNTLQNTVLKEMLLKECFINGIISLPVKTFFNTPQKTYIFSITKKKNITDLQDFPVFAYLVSSIGESLDVDRFETEGKSDLQRAVELFNQFKGAKKSFDPIGLDDMRCKTFLIDKFSPEFNWEIDRWWTKEEKLQLGIEKEEKLIRVEEYKERIAEVPLKIKEFNRILDTLKGEIENDKTKEVIIDTLFDPIKKGKGKYTKAYMRNHQGIYPVYSSQTVKDGVMGSIDSFDYDANCLTWTMDGIYAGTIFLRNGKFSITAHCGVLLLKKEFHQKIDLEYIYCYLKKRLTTYAIGEGNKRLTINDIKKVPISIPIKKNGSFDIKKQKEIAKYFVHISNGKNDLMDIFDEIASLELDLQ